MMNSKDILDREYLEVRARILEIASALDRLDRGVGNVHDDPRLEQLQQAIQIIAEDAAEADRAEKIQLLFSRQYDQQWLSKFNLSNRA